MKKALMFLVLTAVLFSVSCTKRTDTREVFSTEVSEVTTEEIFSETTAEAETESVTETVTETTEPVTVTTTAPATTVPTTIPTTTATTTLPVITTTVPQFPKPYYDQDAAQEILRRTNEQREKHSLPPLTLSQDLCDAAKIRSYEISIFFSHTRPDGSSCDTVFTQDIGENIAYGQTSYDDVFSAWMNSPAHKKNILNEQYTQMGAYCYVESNGVKYWAQLFII